MPADARTPADLPLGEAAALLRAGTLGDEELTAAVLDRFAERAGPRRLGAARRRRREGPASAAGAARRRGEELPLLGVPLAVKDVIDVGGLPTRAGAAAWSRAPDRRCRGRSGGCAPPARWCSARRTPTSSPTASTGATRTGRPCRNPHAEERLAGGSSSGSAVAVAVARPSARWGPTRAESLRVPAALCGVAALRTTRGRRPAGGRRRAGRALRRVGPLAHDVARRGRAVGGAAARECQAGAPRRPPACASGC
jgi:Asp-tRNA(Asn)/Glu-tRNA(Gln) amidotransferase A subunit family amidase